MDSLMLWQHFKIVLFKKYEKLTVNLYLLYVVNVNTFGYFKFAF